MHELSIALSILDVAAETAGRHGGARVAAIHLRLGALSGVVKEALLSAYELAREGSALPDAALVIEEVPLVAYCPACAAERTVSAQQLCCPACGAPTPEVVRGRELEVVALEIEARE
jgi:hydrogenase nickel incorporation protein HypA/HybF